MAHLPDVNCRYGAPMGRGQWHSEAPEEPIRFHLSRVRLNDGGYDRGGAYWGIGAPLYQASSDNAKRDDGTIDYGVEFYLRAYDRDEAKDKVRAKYPNATFYR
jgi:hypothetical protein